MIKDFILSCESTVDLPYDYVSKRDISVLFYTYMLDGKEYEDDMWRNDGYDKKFYNLLNEGKIPTTSQINEYRYTEYFEELVKQGKRILHLAFGSGMTPSVNNAISAADVINEKYGENSVTVIDTLCSCGGYGMITENAADMRDMGSSIEEISDYVNEIRYCIQHQFFSTDLKYFKRSGRVSGLALAAATLLNVCPIMHLNREGKIVAYDKVRGKSNTINKTVDEIVKNAADGKNYKGKIFVYHSDCKDLAEQTKNAILSEMPFVSDLRIYNIGNIIASHCGPGTVAVFFVGNMRSAE